MIFEYDDEFDDEYDSDLGYDGHGDACECDECRLEHAEMECGRLPEHLGGGCLSAGSEYCEFDCPFRNQDETD